MWKDVLKLAQVIEGVGDGRAIWDGNHWLILGVYAPAKISTGKAQRWERNQQRIKFWEDRVDEGRRLRAVPKYQWSTTVECW